MSEEALLRDAKEHILSARMDKATFTGPVLESGQDSIVTDVNGKDYLDFNSGQMCSVLGHRNPRVVEAIKQACDTLIHASSSFFNVQEIGLAKKLGSIVTRPLKRSLFLESGSDANEAAVALSKRYTGRYEVASPHVSFHGMGDGARALTYSAWHGGYGPYAPGMYAMMAPYCYRCPIGLKYPDCGIACLDGAFDVIDAQVDQGLSAVITEPLFSAGGVIEPPDGWLAKLKAKCRERGALFILDEAQTGLGKLGTMWGFEREAVVPDVMTVSKHFGGGVEISAVVTTDEIADSVQEGGFIVGHSHSSDPIACAAANASLDEIIENDLPRRAGELGEYWRSHLRELQDSHEMIGDVRGRGLLQGIELVRDRTTKEPATAEGRRIEDECIDRGLLLSVRRQGSVLRFVPPATTTPAQFDQAAEFLDTALTHAESRGPG
jgi:2,2-dialkylglycine decarboxylase (pyruvate)